MMVKGSTLKKLAGSRKARKQLRHNWKKLTPEQKQTKLKEAEKRQVKADVRF